MLVLFFNDTATTEIYTRSLHDALPSSWGFAAASTVWAVVQPWWDFPFDRLAQPDVAWRAAMVCGLGTIVPFLLDRKSTRLNSSHANISYAVFCLKKKTSVVL